MIPLAAAWLAARAPSAADPPVFDLTYTDVVTLAPSDPELRSRFPCPEGSQVGGIPVIDCDGEEVCPTRILACWGGPRVFDGPTVSWQGERKIAETQLVDGRLDGPFAGWWPDGHLRALGRYEAGRLAGPLHHWGADGSRVTTLHDGETRRTFEFSAAGVLTRETVRSDAPVEPWTHRSWWENGHPREVELDPRAPDGTVAAAWDAAARPLHAWRTRRGRPDGPAFIWTDAGYAVERWRAGRLVGVRLPPGFVPPPSVLECPAGAFEEQQSWAAETSRTCRTLSGFALGPSRATRDDGTVSAESDVDADGRATEIAWCRDGTVWSHHTPAGDGEVSGYCPGGY